LFERSELWEFQQTSLVKSILSAGCLFFASFLWASKERKGKPYRRNKRSINIRKGFSIAETNQTLKQKLPGLVGLENNKKRLAQNHLSKPFLVKAFNLVWNELKANQFRIQHLCIVGVDKNMVLFFSIHF